MRNFTQNLTFFSNILSVDVAIRFEVKHLCFTLNLDQENAGSILYKMLSGFNFFCVSDGFLIRNYHLIEQMNQSNI